MFKRLFLSLMIIFSIILLSACGAANNAFTITFESNGGTVVDEQVVERNERAIEPEDPIKLNYHFRGWYINEKLTIPFDFKQRIITNMTLFAKWELVDDPIDYATLIFEHDGNVLETKYVAKGDTTTPTDQVPSLYGFVFVGWSIIEEGEERPLFDFETSVEDDLILYAVMLRKEVTLHFETYGGTEIPAITAFFESAITRPENPEKLENTFIGWFLDEAYATEFDFTSMPGEETTIYAKWEINQYMITFDTQGGDSVSPMMIEFGTLIPELANATKEGYTFLGWYNENTHQTLFDAELMPSGDRTIYAKWQVNDYTITFVTDGGSAQSPIDFRFGEAIVLPNNPTKTESQFAGWYLDSETINTFTLSIMPATHLTLYAKWNTNVYTIDFNSNQGSVVLEITQAYGSPIEAPEDPTREGYDFVGWFINLSDVEPYVFSSMPSGGLSVIAKWDIKSVTLNFDSIGGDSIDPIIQNFNTALSSPIDPTKEGHTFINWYITTSYQDVFVFDTMPANHLTVYAKWDINHYTITFSDVEGFSFDPVTKPYQSPIGPPEIPDDPLFEDQIIVWYLDEEFTEPYIFDFMPAENKTLYGLRVHDPEVPLRNFLLQTPSTIISDVDWLAHYLDYMFFTRIEEVTLTLDFVVDHLQTVYEEALDRMLMQANVALSLSYSGLYQELTVTAIYGSEAEVSASDHPMYTQRNAIIPALQGSRDSSFDDFAINSVQQTFAVKTSDQLYYVLEQGLRPVFDEPGTQAELMYEAAKEVLREIVDDSMTDIEKLKAMYHWLAFEVTYDGALLDKLIINEPNIHQYRGFYLEGIFLDYRAVCDGFSKALTVFGRIEGLDIVRIVGHPANPLNTVLHAWNKVLLDDEWYILDATSANLIVGEAEEFFTYKFFLIDESKMENYYIATSHLDIIAVGQYNHYETLSFTVNSQTYTFLIDSQEALNALFYFYYHEVIDYTLTIDAYIDFDYGDNFVNALTIAFQSLSGSNPLPQIVYTGNVLIFHADQS